MGVPRRKNLIDKRRTDDDGEEDHNAAGGVDDDSSSQGSIVSDLDDDADAAGSESSLVETPSKIAIRRKNGNKKVTASNGNATVSAEAAPVVPFSATLNDTETMLNGMNISENNHATEEVHFDTVDEPADTPAAAAQEPSSMRSEMLIDRKRREHEEYKKKRDADPAFVPNRGGFFMHDHRSAAPGQNGFRPSGRGRGRGGRGGGIGTFSPLGG